MAKKQLRAARATGSALEMHTMPTVCISEYSAPLHLRQANLDVVGLLAARARVAVPTARLHAELFGIGGANA